jgi:hypothetical protein
MYTVDPTPVDPSPVTPPAAAPPTSRWAALTHRVLTVLAALGPLAMAG